ncbi:MAG TPA: ABC transporter permease [Candidatus Acidoferrales bacterium]|nr:ABC transporter permease [Candidatus Acidoferrales bacterium]
MSAMAQDVKLGLRTMLKSPGFTAVAVATLALGIGANTALFSMVDSFLLRPLPVKNPGQLTVLAFDQGSHSGEGQFSCPDWQDVQAQTGDVFSDVAAYQMGLDGLNVSGHADRLLTGFVSGDYFTMLGLRPALGRLILPSEGKTKGGDPVLVLSYGYWQSHFAGDPGVVGRAVSLDGQPVTIVGVAPKGFHGTYSLLDIQAYLPLGMAAIEDPTSDFMTNRNIRNLFLQASLKPGVKLGQAQAALAVVSRRIAGQNPATEKGLVVRAYPERLSRPEPDPKQQMLKVSALFLLLAALVLLLACVNVANVLLVRATVRVREMAIRAALGGTRARLIRQLLTESILLALAGGVAGLLLGVWASGSIGAMSLGTTLPVRLDFHFDWRVFLYALAAALATGLVVGILPAVRASRGNLSEILHDGGRSVSAGRHRLRDALVVAQVAGSLMLLIVAGLFTRSLGRAQQAHLGFDPNHVVNLSMDPQELGYNQAQGRQFYKHLLARVRVVPGVESASLAFSVPMGYYNSASTLDIPGYQPPPGQPSPTLVFNTISPGYFRTMGIPLASGRSFTDADDENAQHVAIVNQTMADKFWPRESPIGRQFRMNDDPKHVYEVVGVAKDSRINGISSPIDPFFYVPYVQQSSPLPLMTLQVRTSGDAESMIPELEREVDALAPGLPPFDVKTMTQALDTVNGLLIFQVGAALAGALGILGLVLSVVGVYGVVSYAASQRTHEIGIRLALGAPPVQVLKMIFSQGLVVVGIGAAIGMAAAFAIARVVGNFLVGVSPTDPLTYASVTAVLVLVALTASYVPARRAMRLDPVIALRHE